MTSPNKCRLLLMPSACALLLGCGPEDDSNTASLSHRVRTPAIDSLVSDADVVSINSSVSVGDSPTSERGQAEPSIVVPAYESNDEIWVSPSYVETLATNSMTWTPSSSSFWPLPSGPPAVSQAVGFDSYDAWPTSLAVNTAHGGSGWEDTFVVVSTAGTTQRESTNVVAIVSDDRPVNFHSPVVISNGPYLDEEPFHSVVNYPAATFEKNTTGHDIPFFATVWRQKDLDTSAPAPDEIVLHDWLYRRTAIGGTAAGPTSRTLVPDGAYPYRIPIPVSAGPVSIAHSGGVNGYTYVVYPTHDEPALPNPCPSTATIPVVRWRMLTIIGSPAAGNFTDELIATATNWRRCVGSSSQPGGTSTPFNRHSIKPAISVDRHSGRVYVALSHSMTDATGNTQIHVYDRWGGPAGPSWIDTVVSPNPDPTTIYYVGDDWSPAIDVNHYPGTSQEAVTVIWKSTRADTTYSNTRVTQLGRMKKNGAWDPVKDPENSSNTQQIVAPLGVFDSIAQTPHIPYGFIGTWTNGGSAPSTIRGNLILDL